MRRRPASPTPPTPPAPPAPPVRPSHPGVAIAVLVGGFAAGVIAGLMIGLIRRQPTSGYPRPIAPDVGGD